MSFTRRHLPHWIPEETAIFVTWRVAGSPPPQAKIPFLQQDEQLDRMRSSSDWLQDSRIACVVANALVYG
jgi:hypothetical protein